MIILFIRYWGKTVVEDVINRYFLGTVGLTIMESGVMMVVVVSGITIKC